MRGSSAESVGTEIGRDEGCIRRRRNSRPFRDRSELPAGTAWHLPSLVGAALNRLARTACKHWQYRVA